MYIYIYIYIYMYTYMYTHTQSGGTITPITLVSGTTVL